MRVKFVSKLCQMNVPILAIFVEPTEVEGD